MKKIIGEPSYVGFRLRRTINLGEFNSLSVEYSLQLPCEPEGINKAFDKVTAEVEKQMTKKLKEYKKRAQ